MSTTKANLSVEARELGDPIPGPTAVGGDWRRLGHLTWTLATTDFKLKFFGSALGYLWQIMRPLLLFGVLFVVFSLFLDLGSTVPLYPVALLLGIVLFTFLSEATGGAVRSLVTREGLVRKVQFPRLAVPLSVSLTAVFNLGLNLIPVFVFLVAFGGTLHWTWFEIPLLFVLLATLATGLAMLLSALFVRYRDVEPIWDVALQILFYASPVIYPVERLLENESFKEPAQYLLMLNPFALILQQMRHALVDPSYLTAAEAVGGRERLVVPLAIIVATWFVGYRVFKRAAPYVAERL